MSTVTMLLQHEQAARPRLRRFTPQFRGREREHRKMTVVPGLHRWLTEPVQGDVPNEVRAQARAHFGQFIKCAPVDDLYFMKRVEDRRRKPATFGHEVWSISPRFDPPQYRYFGVFVTQDWFLVCTRQARDYLDDIDRRWHREIDRTLKIWGILFPGEVPFGRPDLAGYISRNARHLDDRW